VAAWVANFYLAKYLKIDNNSATTKAREKNTYRFGIIRIA
jgi:hypothetical protein